VSATDLLKLRQASDDPAARLYRCPSARVDSVQVPERFQAQRRLGFGPSARRMKRDG